MQCACVRTPFFVLFPKPVPGISVAEYECLEMHQGRAGGSTTEVATVTFEQKRRLILEKRSVIPFIISES